MAGWPVIAYPTPDSAVTSDSPFPLALSHIVSKDHLLYNLLLTVGLFGLIASFHGLILAAGRVTFELGRTGDLPVSLARIHPRLKTPAVALLIALIGFFAMFFFNSRLGLLYLVLIALAFGWRGLSRRRVQLRDRHHAQPKEGS